MTPRISDELERAVADNTEGALQVEGAKGTYWVLSEEAMRLRTEVLKGLEQADRGDLESWNSEDIKREGRRLLEERTQES